MIFLIDDRVVSFFLSHEICDNDFFDYIDSRIVYIPSGSDVFWYGCHPLIKGDKIRDVRVVVPIVKTDFDIIVNIHEFTHAIEFYNELGCFYNENRIDREKKAHKMEKIYLKNK